MERLTDNNKVIPTLIDNVEYWQKVYFKLKEYEDLEEHSKLVKLPCKIGDTVYIRLASYCKTHYVEAEVKDFDVNVSFINFVSKKKLKQRTRRRLLTSAS